MHHVGHDGRIEEEQRAATAPVGSSGGIVLLLKSRHLEVDASIVQPLGWILHEAEIRLVDAGVVVVQQEGVHLATLGLPRLPRRECGGLRESSLQSPGNPTIGNPVTVGTGLLFCNGLFFPRISSAHFCELKVVESTLQTTNRQNGKRLIARDCCIACVPSPRSAACSVQSIRPLSHPRGGEKAPSVALRLHPLVGN